MNLEIKPCAFCGHTPIDSMDFLHPTGQGWRDDDGHRHYISATDPRPFHGRVWSMHCPEVEGGCGVEMHGDSMEEVVAKWNRRPKPNITGMVNRFLAWKLPKGLCPDGGLSFKAFPHQSYDGPHWPIGTNMLSFEQAKEMFEHCIEGVVSEPASFTYKKDELFKLFHGVPLDEVKQAVKLLDAGPIPRVDVPTEEGWYWLYLDGLLTIENVRKRPGHEYLAVQSADLGLMGKRNFVAVVKLSKAEWYGPIPKPEV